MTVSSAEMWAAIITAIAAGLSVLVRLHLMISGVMKALDQIKDHESRIHRLEVHTGILNVNPSEE